MCLLQKVSRSPSVIESVGCNDHPHQKEERAVESKVVIGIIAFYNDGAVDKIYPRSSPLVARMLCDSSALFPRENDSRVLGGVDIFHKRIVLLKI